MTMPGASNPQSGTPIPCGILKIMQVRVLVLGGTLCVLVAGVGLAALRAQPVERVNGRTALGLVLRQINNTGTFMMATAHPDDENNGVLAVLSKGEGIRTTLVTATRGDGGQNELGPELFDALAALRTEELLAAHRLDGAEQYFTRAVDFGYSFSRDETFEKWGREEILGDFVRTIRTIRPDVIAGLSPDGNGGGQHHQASAVLAHEAYSDRRRPESFSGAAGRRAPALAGKQILLQCRVRVRVWAEAVGVAAVRLRPGRS